MVRNRVHAFLRSAVASVAAMIVVAATLGWGGGLPAANAALSGDDFDPGYIISDERFFDAGAMTESEIQAFFARMTPTCTSDPYVPCLKNFVGLSNNRAASGAGHCQGYTSPGYESAARMVYRIAQTCGINPQVLLVMLQKEQGLITDGYPILRQYNVAMGYACPDTAPCDARYYGFFNQVYMAAWQLREYTLRPNNWRHRIGNTSIYYHPDLTRCGASTVFIVNQATANLYNYTPYQPNRAALANLSGSGDSCSAFGNRNFWRFFTTWFGPTTSPGPAAIAKEYRYQGGAAGPFGAQITGVNEIPENGGGLGQAWVGGSIYWTPTTGAQPVYGVIRDYYFAFAGAAGPLGWPTSRINWIPENGGGIGQAYQVASVYNSPLGTYRVEGALRDAYFARSGAAGPLGFPAVEGQCTSTYCVQSFGGGRIYGSSRTPYLAIPSAILGDFDGAGGVDALGLPLSEYTANSGQMYERASIYKRSGAAGFVVGGTMRSVYWSLGGSDSWLGWPAGAMSCADGVCEQAFERASIVVDGTGSRVVSRELERAVAGSSVALGAPITGVNFHAENGGGVGRAYQNGSAYYKPSAGAWVVPGGPVRDRYFAAGGAVGVLGWPTGAQTCDADRTCSQTFEGGMIIASIAGGARLVAGEFLTRYGADGGAAVLGLPFTERNRIAQNGSGWGQAFTMGSIFAPTGGAAYSVKGGIKDYYFSIGGAAGDFGWPVSVEATSADNGGGSGQAFQRGSIYSSPRGTFGTWGGVREGYWATGGSSGYLGWPTSAVTCAPALCVQQFERGRVEWSAATGYLVIRN